MIDLSGNVALVTGASRGIGAAIADTLAGAGARVIGTATTTAGADALAARLGTGHHGRVLDVADDGSIEALFAALPEPPSILVNNAGITRDGLLARMSNDDWDDVIATNLSAMHRLCRGVLRPMMKARHGRIVNISSVVAQSGNAGQCNYAAAKAGMLGFTRALAREVASRGITVNAVAPGFVESDMTARLEAAQVEALTRDIPLRRLGSGADVAAAVAFLVSPLAAYVTGETLAVNGGLFMD